MCKKCEAKRKIYDKMISDIEEKKDNALKALKVYKEAIAKNHP